MKRKLKGKSEFTISEIKELKRLINIRNKSSRAEQKLIREKMRKIGFFGGDDWGIYDCKTSDLDNLIKSREIKISNLLK